MADREYCKHKIIPLPSIDRQWNLALITFALYLIKFLIPFSEFSKPFS